MIQARCALERRPRGLSLVEVLIGMVLSLFLIGVLIISYTSGRQSFRVQANASQIQEGGRFLMSQFESDLRMAGFRGCNGDFTTLTNALVSPSSLANDFATAVRGFEASGTTWTPTLDPLLAAASPPPEQGSDILTVHRSRGDALPLRVPYMTSNTDDLRIDAGSEIALGDLIMVSDCNAAAVFQTTNSDTGSTGILRHVTGSGTPGNASANLGRRYNGDAQIHRVSTVTYYVGRSQNQSGTSSLWRVTGTGTPVEMVEGIDTMQVQYGVDSDGDRVIDRYLPASGVTDFSQVMSVQLTVVLVSVEDGLTRTTTSYELNGTIVTPSDRRARRVFSTTVALRNKTL